MKPKNPRSIDRIVEDQINRWRQEKKQREEDARPPRPLITISREFGARGAELGRMVAERLGFSFWDQNIVATIMSDIGASEGLMESLDERSRSHLRDIVDSAILGLSATQADYVRRVVEILGTIAEEGAAVVIGRGGQYIVRNALRVRVVAPLSVRVENYAKRQSITVQAAERMVQKMDAERSKFVRQHYNQDVAEPSQYDLGVNTGTFSLDAAADVIAHAYRKKYEDA